MAELPAGQERLLKQLISSRRCKICRQTFDRNHVRVAARDDQLWIVSARCTTCRHQQVFWVRPKPHGLEGVFRDVSDEEEEMFAAMDPVATDEVLDMHEFLAEFNGDFRTLFGH
ncbi:MAG: hypothetical protein NVSMB22_08700 [Chloroflexota bacterium]